MSKQVLFAYNGRVEIDQDGNYYGNELNDKLVERYLKFGENVTFLVRLKLIENSETKGLMPFVNKNLTIVGVHDFSSPIKYIKNVRQVKNIIQEQVKKSNVIIARLPSLIGREAINYAKDLKKPFMVEVVGCPWDALYNHSLLGKVYAPYAYLMLKNQVKNAPFVLYVTTKFLQGRYPSSGETIGVTDVVLDPIEESVLEKRIRKIYASERVGPLVIGTAAGYDVKFKGQEYVIRAIAKLKKQGITFLYQPVGKGTGQRLRQIANYQGVQDLIEFKGQLKHSEVFDYLDFIDIYIQPSKQEGLPRAVIEAMSRACPVIGSDTGGIPELIDKDFIFKKGNVDEIVKILSELNEDKIIHQAKRNYDFAHQFETKKMDDKRLKFYNKFISSYSHE